MTALPRPLRPQWPAAFFALILQCSLGQLQFAEISDALPPALAREMHESQFPTRSIGELKDVRHPSNVLWEGEWLYVASFMHNQVIRIRQRGLGERELFASGRYCAPGAPCAVLDGPWGMAARRGQLFVSSFGTDHVMVFDLASRAFVAAFGGSTVLDCPEGLAFDSAGRLYVASFLSNDVVVFNASRSEGYGGGGGGTYEAPALLRRLRSDHLEGPEDVAFDPLNEHVLVSSHSNHSVLRFSARTQSLGRLVAVIGPAEQALGGPVGIAVDGHGSIFAASYRHNRVVRYTNDGSRGTYKGVYANAEGMRGPSGIAFDASGLLLAVASYDNSRLFLFNTSSHARASVARVI